MSDRTPPLPHRQPRGTGKSPPRRPLAEDVLASLSDSITIMDDYLRLHRSEENGFNADMTALIHVMAVFVSLGESEIEALFLDADSAA